MLSAHHRATLGDGSNAVLHFYVSAMKGPGYEFCLEPDGKATFAVGDVYYLYQIADIDVR